MLLMIDVGSLREPLCYKPYFSPPHDFRYEQKYLSSIGNILMMSRYYWGKYLSTLFWCASVVLILIDSFRLNQYMSACTTRYPLLAEGLFTVGYFNLWSDNIIIDGSPLAISRRLCLVGHYCNHRWYSQVISLLTVINQWWSVGHVPDASCLRLLI